MQRYNILEQERARDRCSMVDFFDSKSDRKDLLYYVMEISRENLLMQSVEKLLQLKKRNDLEPLKKPLKVVFSKEAGIDEGGVAREYLMLLTKEMFDPKLGTGMFN